MCRNGVKAVVSLCLTACITFGCLPATIARYSRESDIKDADTMPARVPGLCPNWHASDFTGVPLMPSIWWSNNITEKSQIQLRASGNRWVTKTAEVGALMANSSIAPRASEFFLVRLLRDPWISLQTSTGAMVMEMDDSVLVVGGEEGMVAEFRISRVCLITSPSSRFVPIRTATLPPFSPSQLLVQSGAAQVRMQSKTGQWLTATPSNELLWTSSDVPKESLLFSVRHVASVPAIRGVNLGGWLAVEGWLKPSLFANVPPLIDGTQIRVQSVRSGCWVSAQQTTVVCMQTETPSEAETFRLRFEFPDSPHGQLQMRDQHGAFLSVEDHGNGHFLTTHSDANAVQPVPRALFSLEAVGSPSDALFRIHAADGGSVQVATANRLRVVGGNEGDLFRITPVGGLQGEWQLSAGLGKSAWEVVHRHRTTFITEEDFKYLRTEGVNCVRIPVGYWITAGDAVEGAYVPGGLAFLDLAFHWAATHGLRVIVDLHGGPGSQSGLPETGSRDGFGEMFSTSGNVGKALDAIEFLSHRYGDHPALLGIELLNEPSVFDAPFHAMKEYYEEGYRRVRRHSACAYVLLSSRWMGTDNELMEIGVGPEYPNLILDVHWYAFWMEESVDAIVRLWAVDKRNLLQTLSSGDRLVLAGEWSVGLPPAGSALNPVVTDEDHRRFGAIQLDVYGGSGCAGWAFWNYKVEEYENAAWDFREARKRGWLPFQEMDRKRWGSSRDDRVASM